MAATAMLPPRILSPGEIIEEEIDPQDEEYVHNFNIHLICPECNRRPPNLIEEFSAGDIVCGDCGLVLSSRVVDTRSEWRTFSNDDQGNDDPSRVGDAANPLLDGSQLSTTIAFGEGANARDLNRAHGKVGDSKSNKNLTAAYKQIGTLCDSYGIPSSVSDTAKHFYKMTESSKQFKGKNQDVIIASCIFLACRRNGVGRTFKEIVALTKVPKREIGRTFKALEKYFQDASKKKSGTVIGGAVMQTEKYQTSQSTNAPDLCTRFSNDLKLPDYVSIITAECAQRMLDQGCLAGRSPLSIAAVAIYLTSHLMGHARTPSAIGGVAGVSEGTIRTAYKAIENYSDLIKKEWLEKGGKMENIPTA